MGGMAFQITSLTIVYSTVYSGADQRKHQSPASLAFVRGIHRSPVSNAETVSIWWRHHDIHSPKHTSLYERYLKKDPIVISVSANSERQA